MWLYTHLLWFILLRLISASKLSLNSALSSAALLLALLAQISLTAFIMAMRSHLSSMLAICTLLSLLCHHLHRLHVVGAVINKLPKILLIKLIL